MTQKNLTLVMHMIIFNILIYSSIQFVPHRDHNVFQLERPTGECCIEKRSLFILRILQITLCVRAAAHVATAIL
jgi:hypothetical protein